MASIEFIKSRRDSYNQYREELNDKKADNYEESIFYLKDYASNLVYFNKIDNRINSLSEITSSIIGKINTEWITSFHNTHYSLMELKSVIINVSTKNIKEEIFKSSCEAYENYVNKYMENYDQYNSILDYVNKLISSYEELERKFDHVNNQLNKATTDTEIEELKGRKAKIKRQEESVLNSCFENVKLLNDYNTISYQLLEKGLKKA